jgi:hypothetical protein
MSQEKRRPVRQSGARKTTIQARRFLAARSTALGSVAALAREIGRPEQTVWRLINGDGIRNATADDYQGILRRLGFDGVTGLEPRTLAEVTAAAEVEPPGSGSSAPPAVA